MSIDECRIKEFYLFYLLKRAERSDIHQSSFIIRHSMKFHKRHQLSKNRILTGKIVSGVKQGAFFTQLDWVQGQCLEKLGFKPFPGTLNLEIANENMAIIEVLQAQKGIELVPPDSSFCSGFVFPITVDGIPGAMVAPAADVRVHAKNIIEIISHLRLKDALGVADGDWVTLTIES
jgi:CTP-dependent riboflavin kinase